MYGNTQNFGCFGGMNMNTFNTQQPNYMGLYANKQDSLGSRMRSNAMTMSPYMSFGQQYNQTLTANRWLPGIGSDNSNIMCRSNSRWNMQYSMYNGSTEQLPSYMNPSQSHNNRQSYSTSPLNLPSMSPMSTLPWQNDNYMPSIMPLTQYNSLMQQRQQPTTQNGSQLMSDYRDTAGGVGNFMPGVTTKSDVNTKPTSGDQLLNRIDSITSFSDDHGCRRRDSLHDLREYGERLKARKLLEENVVKPIKLTQSAVSLKETKSKNDLKNEIKELKKMVKLHTGTPNKSISQILHKTAETSPITKTQLMNQIVSLKHQLKNYKELTDSKSKRELKQEVYRLKRRLKERDEKHTSKWKRGLSFFGFNKIKPKSTTPPHNSDRAVLTHDSQKDKLYADSMLRGYPRGSTNTMNNFVAIQPRFHDTWLDYNFIQEFENKSNDEESSIERLSPKIKNGRRSQNSSYQNLKVKTPKIVKRKNSVKFEALL